MPEALRLCGPLDRSALERAVQCVVARHESLRTSFAEIDGEPVQVIGPSGEVPMPIEDLRGMSGAAQDQRLRVLLRDEWEMPFDLARGSVLRMKLVRMQEDEHVLLRTFHHIVSDAWSQAIFNSEMLALYDAFLHGRSDPLPPLPLQYADYALWQRRDCDAGTLDEGVAYWTKQLAGMPERLDLPADSPRAAAQSFTGAACRMMVGAEQLAALRQIGHCNGATLYMTLLTALCAVLNYYTGQRDIVVGSATANRDDPRLEALIGFFVNTFAVRVPVEAGTTFRDLLACVRRTTLGAYRYLDVPFERVVEALAPRRSLDAPVLYQVGFGLQNTPWTAPALPGLKVERVRDDEPKVRCDLEIHAHERDEGLAMLWAYNASLFEGWRIEQMGRHYARVLDAIVADLDQRL